MTRPRGPAALLVACLGLGACAAPAGSRPWGADVTATPGLARLGRAGDAAARSPATWGPLLAAALLRAGGVDQRISRWARERTPVFGSRDAAESRSDDLRDALQGAALASALSAPGAAAPGERALATGKGLAVQGAAVQVTSLLTQAGKRSAGRTRPNGANDRSFPSGHASAAAVAARLAERNLHTRRWNRAALALADGALAGGTAGTAWARVEAGVHYPTDVLAGMALGNFVAAFVHDGFMGLALDQAAVHHDRRRRLTRFALAWRF